MENGSLLLIFTALFISKELMIILEGCPPLQLCAAPLQSPDYRLSYIAHCLPCRIVQGTLRPWTPKGLPLTLTLASFVTSDELVSFCVPRFPSPQIKNENDTFSYTCHEAMMRDKGRCSEEPPTGNRQ
jgi:hypothetical protein